MRFRSPPGEIASKAATTSNRLQVIHDDPAVRFRKGRCPLPILYTPSMVLFPGGAAKRQKILAVSSRPYRWIKDVGIDIISSAI
jgi:hypothetical protein